MPSFRPLLLPKAASRPARGPWSGPLKKLTGCIVAVLALTSFAEAHAQTGKASYYGGRGRTASGGHVGHMTAAHRTLPFGTLVRVTNLSNQRTATVTVNDRGPFVRGRIIDVSTGAAGVLGMRGSGVAPVRIEVVSRGTRVADASAQTAPAASNGGWNLLDAFTSGATQTP